MAAPTTQADATATAARLPADDLVVVQALLASMNSPMADRARAVARRSAIEWPAFVDCVVAQELSPRCLRMAGDLCLSLPREVRQRFEQAAAAAAVRARRQQFTLFRFLEAAAALETILLKGSALASSDYDDPAERHMIDIDVLVRRADVSRACAAAATFGHVPGPRSLPAFFHGFVHFELLLQPAFDGMVPIDLHWRLHHESLLLTVDHEALWRRRRVITVWGRRTARLAREDEWLHLATHLFANRGGVPVAAGERDLGDVLLDRSGSLHGKWLRDLVVATEGLAASAPPSDLAATASEWSATQQAAAALTLILPLLSPPASRFADAVRTACVAQAPAPTDTAGTPRAAPAPLHAWQHAGAHPAFGFRLRALRRLGQWSWPPSWWFRRLCINRCERQPSAPRLAWLRIRHASGVLLRSLAAALLLPFAFAARPFAARRRQLLQRRAREPAGVMAHAQRMASFERLTGAAATPGDRS